DEHGAVTTALDIRQHAERAQLEQPPVRALDLDPAAHRVADDPAPVQRDKGERGEGEAAGPELLAESRDVLIGAEGEPVHVQKGRPVVAGGNPDRAARASTGSAASSARKRSDSSRCRSPSS